MSNPGKGYNLAAISMLVNGVDISGFADADDVLVLEDMADLSEVNVGADGETVVSMVNNSNVDGTIRLMETSRAYKLLNDQLDLWATSMALGVFPPVTVTMIDPFTGDAMSTLQVAFRKRPQMSKGRRAGVREFPITLINPKRVVGAANVI